MQAIRPESSLEFPALTCLPARSRFFVRPRLLTHGSPLPVGRDISRSTLGPVLRTVRPRGWAERLAAPWHLAAAMPASPGGGPRRWRTAPHTPGLARAESALAPHQAQRRPAWGLSHRALLPPGLATGLTRSAWSLARPRVLWGGEAGSPQRGGTLRGRGDAPVPVDPHRTLNVKTPPTRRFASSPLGRSHGGVDGPPGTCTVEPHLADRWAQPNDPTDLFRRRPGGPWHHKPPGHGRARVAEEVQCPDDRCLNDQGTADRHGLEAVAPVAVGER